MVSKGGSQARNEGLNKIEKTCQQTEDQSGVGGEQGADVYDDPAIANGGRSKGVFLEASRGEDYEQKCQGQGEESKGEGTIAEPDEQEGSDYKQTEEGLHFAGADRHPTVRLAEHLGNGNEMEDEAGGGGQQEDAGPFGPAVQDGRQGADGGYPVADCRDPEPQNEHL